MGSWPSFFGIMVYHLWNDSNNLVFGISSMLQSGLIYQALAQTIHIHKDLKLVLFQSLMMA